MRSILHPLKGQPEGDAAKWGLPGLAAFPTQLHGLRDSLCSPWFKNWRIAFHTEVYCFWAFKAVNIPSAAFGLE
jgi:hypothetical protein